MSQQLKVRLAGKLRANVALFWTVVHAVVFQVVWLVNITMDLPLAIAATAFACCLYFYSLYTDLGWSKQGTAKAALWIGVVASIGFVVETLFFQAGWLRLTSSDVARIFSVPIWLLLIWVAFACAFFFCFKFLLDRIWTASAVGAFAFLSYLGGGALSPSVDIGDDQVLACVAIGATWAVVLPLLLIVYRKMGLAPSC